MGTMRENLLTKLKEVGRPVEDQEKIIECAGNAIYTCRGIKLMTVRVGYCWNLGQLQGRIPFGLTSIASTSTSSL